MATEEEMSDEMRVQEERASMEIADLQAEIRTQRAVNATTKGYADELRRQLADKRKWELLRATAVLLAGDWGNSDGGILTEARSSAGTPISRVTRRCRRSPSLGSLMAVADDLVADE
jgi:hypothetical protein